MKVDLIKHTRKDNINIKRRLYLSLEEEKEIRRQVEILKQQYEEMKERIEKR